MLLGALGGLLGWDLSDFALRLRYAARRDDIKEMERRHLARVGVVAVLGIVLALFGTFIQTKRLAFEVAVGLILLAVLGLVRQATNAMRKFG
jgi:membrane protein YqaA with SNARE-associated domain